MPDLSKAQEAGPPQPDTVCPTWPADERPPEAEEPEEDTGEGGARWLIKQPFLTPMDYRRDADAARQTLAGPKPTTADA